jgi:hypothetical protein
LAELKQSGLENGDSEELKSLIDHWIHVIDRWVQNLDQGMGGTADGADPAVTPDPAPEPTRESPPALEAG